MTAWDVDSVDRPFLMNPRDRRDRSASRHCPPLQGLSTLSTSPATTCLLTHEDISIELNKRTFLKSFDRPKLPPKSSDGVSKGCLWVDLGWYCGWETLDWPYQAPPRAALPGCKSVFVAQDMVRTKLYWAVSALAHSLAVSV